MEYTKAKKSRQSWSGPFRAKSKPSKHVNEEVQPDPPIMPSDGATGDRDEMW